MNYGIKKLVGLSLVLFIVLLTTMTTPIASGASYIYDGQFKHRANTSSSVLGGTSRSTDVVVISIGTRREGSTLLGMARLRIWSRNSRIPGILGFTEDSFNYVTTDRAYVQFQVLL